MTCSVNYRCLLVLTMLIFCCAIGCSERNCFVTGTVTVGGKPLPLGQVVFHSGEKVYAGKVQKGEYTVYNQGKAGIPMGTYKVSVTAITADPILDPYGKVLNPDEVEIFVEIPPKYQSNETSGLVFEANSARQEFPIAL